MNFKIGIDGGGSKTHAVLTDSNNKTIDEFTTTPANIKTDINQAIISIKNAISHLLAAHNISRTHVKIGIGVAGFSARDNLQILKHELNQEDANIIITSDAHIACLSAHKGEDGAVIICGTGVVAYWIKQDRLPRHSVSCNDTVPLAMANNQLAGWGFPHGDGGGGAWLGLEICKLLCKAIDGIIPFSPLLKHLFTGFNQDKNSYKAWLIKAKPQDYAEVARILPEFVQIDKNAFKIWQNALKEISALVVATKKQCAGLDITITGGLAKFYYSELNKKFSDLQISNQNNALGAIYLLKD